MTTLEAHVHRKLDLVSSLDGLPETHCRLELCALA